MREVKYIVLIIILLLIKFLIKQYQAPFPELEQKLEIVKSNLIDHIKLNDSIYNIYGDDWIDSINSINISISKLDNINGKFTRYSNGYKVITFNNDLRREDLRFQLLVMQHEFYHYYDYLLGFWSTENSDYLRSYIDSSIILNIDNFQDKISILGLYIDDYFYKDFKESFTYYTSPSELFSRIGTLRQYMIDNEILKRGEKITVDDIDGLCELIHNIGDITPFDADNIIILMILDFSEIFINPIEIP